ncbi:polycystin-2-like [Physella acuta]|uniref:polycystin-2-like n=1 Tax=Physella acuta TaxID=109671 RepID=UPI0027DE9C8C|nr:polycystin-2-like [Physella acuta]
MLSSDKMDDDNRTATKTPSTYDPPTESPRETETQGNQPEDPVKNEGDEPSQDTNQNLYMESYDDEDLSDYVASRVQSSRNMEGRKVIHLETPYAAVVRREQFFLSQKDDFNRPQNMPRQKMTPARQMRQFLEIDEQRVTEQGSTYRSHSSWMQKGATVLYVALKITMFLLAVGMTFSIGYVGLVIQNEDAYLITVLLTFAATNLIAHPIFIFIIVILTEDEKTLCRTEGDYRWKRCLEELVVCFKMCALGMTRIRKSVCRVELSTERREIIWLRHVSFNLKNNKENLLAVKVAAKQGSKYFLFLITIVIIMVVINIQSGNVSQRYRQTGFFRKLLHVGRAEFDLKQGITMEEFWKHLRQNMHLTTYWSLVNTNTTASLNAVSNIRLRQVRVQPYAGDCAKDFPMKPFARCHFRIEDSVVDTRNYALAWDHVTSRKVSPGPYTYSDSEGFETVRHTYPGGGYNSLFSVRDKRPEMIDFLRDHEWVDEHTRAVAVEFAIFNADTNQLTSVLHVYEFTEVGIFQDTPVFYTFPLFFDKQSSIILRAFLVALMFLTLYYLSTEITELYHFGCAEYFSSFTACLTFLERIISIIAIYLFIRQYILQNDMIKHVQNIYFNQLDNFVFVEFNKLSDISFKITLTCSAMAILMFIKVLMQSNNIPALADFLMLLPPTAKITYLPVFVIICFSVLASLVFTEFSEFSTVKAAFLNVTGLLLNQGLMPKIVRAYRLIGQIYLCTTFAFLNFIIVNYYIMILTEHYAEICILNQYLYKGKKESLIETIGKWIHDASMKKKLLKDEAKEDEVERQKQVDVKKQQQLNAIYGEEDKDWIRLCIPNTE